MMTTREVVIDELKHRGIVPENCVIDNAPHRNHFDVDERGIVIWRESMPGRYMDGIRIDLIPYYDHGGESMVEVHREGGIEWHLTRVIFSQPSFSVQRLRNTVQNVYDNLDLKMIVVEDLGGWYNGDTTLCVYTPVAPLPFDDFRRTFRFWIIMNINLNFREFRNGILPTTLSPPQEQFFDLVKDGTLSIVMIGLNQTLNAAWNALPIQPFIEYDTFVFIWNKYRKHNQNVVRLTFRVVFFVSRLRFRVADRATYEPGGANHMRLVSQWSTMMNDI